MYLDDCLFYYYLLNDCFVDDADNERSNETFYVPIRQWQKTKTEYTIRFRFQTIWKPLKAIKLRKCDRNFEIESSLCRHQIVHSHYRF